ncbi:hypothetical protein ACODT3_42615 [Streptomyces sp. 4.24]|uniref:hypothetical protein n=1 Tax=Streptomyces tritrimontium TaxID=3406573 RepID=UPI003BB491BC
MAATTPAPAVDPVEKAEEMEGPALSAGAAFFVVFVAFVGTILATIDVFINGWLPALAHVGWFLGIFLTIALVMGLFLGLVLGGRHAARAETTTSP